jgi:hypothetical protein
MFLFFITSCTPTLTNVWKNENYQGGIFKNILVIVPLQDAIMKRMLEDEFVNQLASHKTDSVASHEVFINIYIFNDKFFASKIKEQDTDATLITRLIKVNKGEIPVTEKNFIIPESYYDWYRFYSSGLEDTQSPKYRDEDYLIIMETNLYDTNDEKLIWSGRSEISIVLCACTDIKPIVKAMVDRLSSDKLIN